MTKNVMSKHSRALDITGTVLQQQRLENPKM